MCSRICMPPHNLPRRTPCPFAVEEISRFPRTTNTQFYNLCPKPHGCVAVHIVVDAVVVVAVVVAALASKIARSVDAPAARTTRIFETNAIRNFKWLSTAAMEKNRTCKLYNTTRRLETLEFQKSQRPLAHQSLLQPHNTTPSRCCACMCELQKGANAS